MSRIEDENLLDVDTAEVPSNNAETANTFGRNLLRRLDIPHGHTEAEAASTSLSTDITNGDGISLVLHGQTLSAQPLVNWKL